MKKGIIWIISLVFVLTLSACQEQLDITQGIIDVQYENVRYEGSSIVVDVYITNGTDASYDVNYVELWFEFPESTVDEFGITDIEFCGAGFDIYETVKSQGYKQYEIEFTSEYIFYSQTELESYQLTLDDLELYFWIEE